ncbi:MAG: hypothetical protein QF578_01275 [Alphaproteobacteria bacterium]|jgi:hypothetical protein|nr:hypothetical protein [Alphaproteobacteria bacterium]MDP6815287.1 hypothetical protein [Alphaproteobacteria bacterium]
MDDDLKHADQFEEEIRGLIEKSVHDDLFGKARSQNICAKCLAVLLLDFAAYAATAAGASGGEILAAVAAGANMAEEEFEFAEEQPPTPSRH